MHKHIGYTFGVAALVLAGCGGGGFSGPATGQLTVAVTDAPVDTAAAVVVGFTGVSVKPAGGPAQDYVFCEQAGEVVAQTACAEPVLRQIDLLALQGGAREALLEAVELPAGEYNWLRLHVRADGETLDSYFEDEAGGVHPLHVPSGDQSGLHLNGGFTVPEGGLADLTIDFDLRKSVHRPAAAGQTYRLRPALRLVQTADSGAVAGQVAADLLHAAHCTGGSAVYVFAGAGTEPRDVRGTAGDPAASAQVMLDPQSGEYRYHAAFLPAGDYTVAFTCQGVDDEPDQTDAIVFDALADVSVAAGQVTVRDLGTP